MALLNESASSSGAFEVDIGHDDSSERPVSKSHVRTTIAEAGSGFGKHRHLMDAPKLLINLLYLALAQSSEAPGWSQREIKKPARGGLAFTARQRRCRGMDRAVSAASA
ncbi:hypothetical protein [Acidovorax delafieldii]|uniref:hypothetical protein n=1 Tax=Acidovorax delafieldii TaxID=47920 RepID=UPI0012FD9BE0|nr:hypothetical protein [Acidovorax delafieldii]